jgi:hypothetical protein
MSKDSHSLDPDTDGWHIVTNRKFKGEVPFKFKDEHPKRFHHSDFAIWAAFYPEKARSYFSSVLVDAFQHSLKGLIDLSGEKLPKDISCFSKPVSIDSWFRSEFESWGMIFSHLWINPTEREPHIYRMIPKDQKDWAVNQPWLCNITPRVFSFGELGFQERSIYTTDEDEYLEDEDARSIELKHLSIGARFLGDMSTVILLQPNWGFNEKGEIAFRGTGHDQYLWQNRMTLVDNKA